MFHRGIPLLVSALFALAGSGYAVEIAAPYVPTAPSVVERMLEIARVGREDYVIDLGSGDGRINITAATKHGARGHGVEIDPQLVSQARANARAAGVSDRVSFVEGDLFAADLSRATVVTMYLLRRSTIKLRDRLLQLKPGTRIVSHAGSMDDWKADRFEMLDVKDRVRADAPVKTYIHYWIVPARVAGTWRWKLPAGGRTVDYELELSQSYQMVSGTLRAGGKEVTLQEASLEGERIALAFTADIEGRAMRHTLAGRVIGNSIVGTAAITGGRAKERLDWKAGLQSKP
ncbi:MAG TPA: methyltransferase domain-containing protein [Burkholderiales bacterium]|jgi:ubiquinone/menaquinone biosynthesis C-methylase UbiE